MKYNPYTLLLIGISIIGIILLIIILAKVIIVIINKFLHKSPSPNPNPSPNPSPSSDPGPPYLFPVDAQHNALINYFEVLYPRNRLALNYKGNSIHNMNKQTLLQLYKSLIFFYNPVITPDLQSPFSDVIPVNYGETRNSQTIDPTILDNLNKQTSLILGNNSLKQYVPNWILDISTKKSIINNNSNSPMPAGGINNCGKNIFNPPGITTLFDNTIDKCFRPSITSMYPACSAAGNDNWYPYRWSGAIPIVSPIWVASYIKMGGFPNNSYYEGYTAPGECGVPTECQGGNLGRLPSNMTEHNIYGGKPMSLPVTFKDGEKPSMNYQSWWDFGFNPSASTNFTELAKSYPSSSNTKGKSAPEHTCLPFATKLKSNKDYIQAAYKCDMSKSTTGATDFTKPVTGATNLPGNTDSCCSVADCSKSPPSGQSWNNYPCTEVTLSAKDPSANPFIDIYSDPKTHGYLDNSDAITKSMTSATSPSGDYTGYAYLPGSGIVENYNDASNTRQYKKQNISSEYNELPLKSGLTNLTLKLVEGANRNIEHLFNTNLSTPCDPNKDTCDWKSVSSSVLPGIRWYWPLKGYGIFSFLGNTHSVATKYGFLLEGSSDDSRPESRKMITVNSKKVPIGGGIPIAYFCTAPKANKLYNYYSMDTPFKVGDGKNTYNFPTPLSPEDLKDTSKYSASIIYNSMSTWILSRVFSGSQWHSLSAAFLLGKQVNDLYAAVGDHSGGFPGYPSSGQKLSFAECKQMVTLFNITGMIPILGLKGCNKQALKDMSQEVWMAQFSNGTLNPYYSSNTAKKYIAVTEWKFVITPGGKPEMVGCMYDWGMTTIDGATSDLIPEWNSKTKTLQWTAGTANNAWPVGAFFMMDQIEGDCQSFLTAISADRQYNSLQLTASLQGLFQPGFSWNKCKATNTYSPEVLKILCNPGDADWNNTPDISGCFNPYNNSNTPSAGTWFSPTDSNGDHIVRIPSENGQFTSTGIGKYIDTEGDVNFVRDGDGKLSNNPYIKNQADVCGSAYLLDPFEDFENYVYCGFVRAEVINKNREIGIGAGVRLFDPRIMSLTPYSPITNIAAYGASLGNKPYNSIKEKYNDNGVSTWQIIQHLPYRAVGWKGFDDKEYLNALKSPVDFFDALTNILNNTKKVFYMGGNEFDLLPTIDKYKNYCCTANGGEHGPYTIAQIQNKFGWDVNIAPPPQQTGCTDDLCKNRICSDDDDPCSAKTINLLNALIDAMIRGVEIVGYWTLSRGGDQSYTIWANSHYLGSDGDNQRCMGSISTINYIYQNTWNKPVTGSKTKMAWENWKVIPMSDSIKSFAWLPTAYVHSKMYIADPNNDENAVYLGSQNLTFTIGKETGIGIYNCKPVAKSVSRLVGYLRYLMWYSQGNCTWTELWGNDVFKSAKKITYDIVAPYLFYNLFNETTRSKIAKVYNVRGGYPLPSPLTDLNNKVLYDSNDNDVNDFPTTCYSISDYLDKRPDINSSDSFTENVFARNVGTDENPFSNKNWYGQNYDLLQPDVVNSIIQATHSINTWWNLPKTTDTESFKLAEKDMMDGGWGNNNIEICKKGPEWPGDLSTTTKPIECNSTNPIRVSLTKQIDPSPSFPSLWPNVKPDPNYYSEYNSIKISSSMIVSIQGRETAKESVDLFMAETDQYMFLQTMEFYSYTLNPNRSGAYPDNYVKHGLVSAANRGANININVTNFGNICGIDCTMPSQVQGSPYINPNYVDQTWLSLYGSACSESNKSYGSINAKSFNFGSQPIYGTTCQLPSGCTDAKNCKMEPTAAQEDLLFFKDNVKSDGSTNPKCANYVPVPNKKYPTSNGTGLDHGRVAVNEKSVYLSNNNFMSIEFLQDLGGGFISSHPSIVQEFTRLTQRDYYSKYSFDIVGKYAYPGINQLSNDTSPLTQINNYNEDLGPAWVCWDPTNTQRPCGGKEPNLEPDWINQYSNTYLNGNACTEPTIDNSFWPGTSSTCMSHPACTDIESKLNKRIWSPYGDPDPTTDQMPYYSVNSQNKISNNKGVELTNSQDLHNTLRFRSPLQNSNASLTWFN